MLDYFIKDFGKPIYKGLNEIGWKGEVDFNAKLQYSLEVLLEINKNEPVAVLFTPNGNYGNAFVEGESINGIITKSSPLYPPKFNSLYVDIDIKHTTYQSLEEVIKQSKETRESLGIEPTRAGNKYGGPHLFWIIHPDDRVEVDSLFSVEEFERILEYVSLQFDGGDKSVARMTGLMRLPTTLHWKKSNVDKVGTTPLATKLYQYYNGEFQEEYNPEKKKYIRTADLLRLRELANEEAIIEKASENLKKSVKPFLQTAVQNISFSELIDALKGYPRVFKPTKSEDKRLDGKKYVFETAGNNIHLRFEDGLLYRTNGYKIRGDHEGAWGISFVNNFTKTRGELEYDIYSRPRGDVYSFLINYFHKNYSAIFAFLKKEFNIEVSNINTEMLEETDKILQRGSTKLLCNKDGLFIEYQKQVGTESNKLVIMLTKIFDINLVPIGFIRSKLNEEGNETTEENKLYVFYDNLNKRRVILRRYSTKSSFNRYVNSLGIHSYVDEDILALMFNVLDRINLREIKEIRYNGMYENFVLLGGDIIYKNKDYVDDDYYINTRFKYQITQNKKQVDTKEFCDMMLKSFDERFVYLPILQTSAMMLMNVWQDTIQIPIYPALMLTGNTGRGKSTLVNILKSYGGYFGKSRELSVGGRNASPQPVRQAATDGSILFLEEVTGVINPATEATVRAIINRDNASTGVSAGKNITYNFKSPILALGQRTFSEDSINNRFLIMDMDQQKKLGTQEEVNEPLSFSCTEYIYKKAYENLHLIKSLYEKFSETLIKEDLIHRARDAVVFIFIMNEILDMRIPFQRLLEHVKWHLKNVGLDRKHKEVSPELKFKSMLVSGFMSRAIMGTYTDYDNEKKQRYELYISKEFLEQNRAALHTSIAFFNEKAKEEGLSEVMYMLDNMLVINVNLVGAKKVDEVLDLIMSWLAKATKGVLTYVPTF